MYGQNFGITKDKTKFLEPQSPRLILFNFRSFQQVFGDLKSNYLVTQVRILNLEHRI